MTHGVTEGSEVDFVVDSWKLLDTAVQRKILMLVQKALQKAEVKIAD
ncbi:MAG: hypothetical protein LBT89_00995 [Planctomycetaceae bacterium]|jgi:hypothetical protein|nr:hypothetical protein [Planctomycetaceae bacterium]